MNSLEFINREIMYTQKEENIVKIQIESTPNDRELQIKLKVIQECLSHLQQIKSVLEAWEIAKIKRVSLLDVELSFDIDGYNDHLGNQYRLNETEYQTLLKALEVDNSVKWVEHTLKDFKGAECEK